MIRVLVLASLLLGALSLPAAADCAGDVAALKARLAREKDPTKSFAAKRQVTIAQQNIKGSESECRNAVTRAWRIFNAPAEPQQAAKPAYGVPLQPKPGQPLNTVK
jgi:hypothetical protein